MATWTITDFLGNSVTFEADNFEDALDMAYDDDLNRLVLYGTAENWEIVSSDGQRYPRLADYDWERNHYDYDPSLRGMN